MDREAIGKVVVDLSTLLAPILFLAMALASAGLMAFAPI